jgi:hypothetical protein
VEAARRAAPVTYKQAADLLGLRPPHTIHRVTVALETLMAEDAAADQPFIAALVVSRTRAGLPGPGFFDMASRVGRFTGEPSGPEAAAYHAGELAAAIACYA